MMSVTVRKYLFEMALLTVLTAGMGVWIFDKFYPGLFLAHYVWIPVYFCVAGAVLMPGVARKNGEPKRLVQMYMLARIVKLFVSVIAVVAFCLATHTEVAVVVVAFVINYIVYLVYDSWFFSRLGKKSEKGK